ncbi:MAG TPA: hypothetical protein PJ991_07980 [Kiritimatiellia bacterium]|nr:hypothetical protein [Kiritimatiellia bacterium]
MSQEWDIKSRARECAISGRPFADQEKIYSCLVRGDENYERRDVSADCWGDMPRENVMSYWRTVYIAPPPPAEEPLKKETVETLLRQFMSRDDYSRIEVVFILAVMLERKRILVERDVQRKDDGTKIRIYEHRQTGEIFTIPDPELRLDQIGEVQAQVNELLGIGPEKPANPAPEPEKSTD